MLIVSIFFKISLATAPPHGYAHSWAGDF